MKRKHEEHVNHERWLVSYADFITLMFAFFVVMFASSQADKEKLKQVSENVTEALKQGNLQILGGRPENDRAGNINVEGLKNLKPAKPKTAELTPSLQNLTKALDEDIKKGTIQVSMEARGLVISLREAAFFPSGSDLLMESAYSAVAKVAGVLNKVPNPVRLEGHTDNLPIHSGRFQSNWELSAARSIAMLNALQTKFGVDPKRLAVVGYADTVAVDTNDTHEGRMRNRRVDIAILNDSAMSKEAGYRPGEKR